MMIANGTWILWKQYPDVITFAITEAVTLGTDLIVDTYQCITRNVYD